MIDVVESLILDLLEWVASREKTYEEVMDPQDPQPVESQLFT